MIGDEEGMNNALDYYTEQDKLTHYWGDWTDEDPYTNVDSAEEMAEEQDYWEGYEYDDGYDYDGDYWDGYDWDSDDDDENTEIWREMKEDEDV